MYNKSYSQQQKQDFIKSVQNNNLNTDVLKSVFNSVALFEVKYDKDITEFTETELIEFYKGFSHRTILIYNGMLSLYLSWFKAQGYTHNTINTAELLQVGGKLGKLSKNTISSYYSENEIEELLSYMVNPNDLYLVYALYSGIKGNMMSEISYLRPDDLDAENLTVNLSAPDEEMRPYIHRKIKVTRRLMNYAIQSSRLKIYVSSDGKKFNLTGCGILKFQDKGINSYNDMNEKKYLLQCREAIAAKFKVWKAYPGFENISSKMIYFSGLINTILKKGEELNIPKEELLTNKNIRPILKQYNYTVQTWFRDLFRDGSA